VKVPVFWNITPCGIVCRYKRFGEVSGSICRVVEEEEAAVESVGILYTDQEGWVEQLTGGSRVMLLYRGLGS
jgi:hypothetical protein